MTCTDELKAYCGATAASTEPEALYNGRPLNLIRDGHDHRSLWQQKAGLQLLLRFCIMRALHSALGSSVTFRLCLRRCTQRTPLPRSQEDPQSTGGVSTNDEEREDDEWDLVSPVSEASSGMLPVLKDAGDPVSFRWHVGWPSTNSPMWESWESG